MHWSTMLVLCVRIRISGSRVGESESEIVISSSPANALVLFALGLGLSKQSFLYQQTGMRYAARYSQLLESVYTTLRSLDLVSKACSQKLSW